MDGIINSKKEGMLMSHCKPIEGSDFFIKTIVCQILGKREDDVVLETFKNFRNHVIDKNSNYGDMLKVCDAISPMILGALIFDKDMMQMAQGLYEIGLLPICQLTHDDAYEQAIKKYSGMILMLSYYYGLEDYYHKIGNKVHDAQKNTSKLVGPNIKKTKMKWMGKL